MYLQEVDLLKIRLKYLYEYVDFFVIVESIQLHSGKIKKEFHFEKNKDHFHAYMDKIIYIKINDTHNSYKDIINFLKIKNNTSSKLILKNLELAIQQKLLKKNQLNWVLDSYHRESILVGLIEYLDIRDHDIVIFSDLDEIPNFKMVQKLKKLKFNKPIVSKQHQFTYYLNMHMKEYWFGSIAANWRIFKHNTINNIRNDVRSEFKNTDIYDEYLGYHFTSCGGLNLIKNKIKSYSHQEFNNFIVLFFLSYNIASGHDIFGRSFNRYSVIHLDCHQNYFDKKIQEIILKYPKMLNFSKNNKSNFIFFIFFLLVKIPKYYYQLTSKLKFNMK